ncbi:ExbD/TolR family protein [Schlesneria paludicola]|uniref:ExbD/TolR family protein n=1 Tax=Schlesneria paludicola TaxID=360056 RepID=UPI00029AE499|nr:biopolymer transporter ExbD [Schlesneria paludicola]
MARRGLFSDAGSFGGGRKVADGEMDITPMIDVTFLLLIFFMVASTMQGTPDVDVPPAQHSIGVDSASATVVTILAPKNSADSPHIVMGDGAGEEADLADVRRYVEESVRDRKNRIVLKAEGDVSHGLVDEVSQAIKSVDGAELFMGVGDKPKE